MKQATFFEGVFIALIVGFISSVLLFTLSSFFPTNILIRFLISGISFAYLLYLLTRSNERVGRVSVVTIWFISMTTLWFSWPPITLFILGHLLSIWLVRSLYFYSSLISSFADLALNSISVVIAFVVASHTNSVFLTLWCFFLIQALFVMIPRSIQKSTSNTSTPFNNDDFQHSYRAAEAAVRQLSTPQ
ncbi:MAG: hypothetical protein GQ547_06745 [Methylophaga sp.]|nr:hypothetical protein [Methylophaga sp.]